MGLLGLWVLAACGSPGGGSSNQVGGSIQGFSLPADSKAVLLSLSSNPIFKLGETAISGGSFSLNLPTLPDVAALGPVFEAPTGCSGVAVQPPDADSVWAGFSLEVSGQPAGELLAQSGDRIARWVYAEEATSVKGTLSCPALAAGVRAQAGEGSVYDLTLQAGWNLVLTDAQETRFSSAPLSTAVDWNATTPNDLSTTSGSDDGSTATRLKGTLGVAGYGVALQVLNPTNGLPSPPLAAPVATASSSGAFDLALPATLNASLLGVASGLNSAGCEGTLSISNPTAQLGKLSLSIYRGKEVVGSAALVTYATTVGWWFASSAFNVSGQEACGSGDSVDITQYSLSLQPGWNLVSRLDDRVRRISKWSNLGSIPSGGKWLPELDDAGVGVSPGPSGGSDRGSTATRMVGKLGGWTDNQAATLKLESDGGVGLVTGPLSASGEFDLTLPASVDNSALEPLELTQDCGTLASTPASPSGVRASLQPDRNDTPLGTIAVGGRGFTVDWVYAATAVQLSGTENCPSGDGGSEEHRYNINFVAGWNLLIEQVFFKDGLEYTEHKSGTLPAGSQWFFEADGDAGLPDGGSTNTTLRGTVGAGFAGNSLRLKVGSTQIGTAITLGAGGEAVVPLPAPVAPTALTALNPTRAACAGTLSVTPASRFGVLSLEVWSGSRFRSAVEISNEDSDGSLEKLYWWYLNQDATVSGTQSCAGEVSRTFKYNLALRAGWNLVLEHEEEDPSGDRDTKYSLVTKVPDGTRWGTN